MASISSRAERFILALTSLKKAQEFPSSPPLCLQHQALWLNTATHLLFILIPKGFGGPTCFTDCCGSLIFSIKSEGRKRRRRGGHEIQYIGGNIGGHCRMVLRFLARVSVGFCSSPCDLLCAISLQLIGNSTDLTPPLSLSFPFSPRNTAGVWLPGGLNLPPYMVVVSSVLPNGLFFSQAVFSRIAEEAHV